MKVTNVGIKSLPTVQRDRSHKLLPTSAESKPLAMYYPL